MPSCEEVLEEQLAWHKLTKQGCAFAAFMSKDPKKFGWERICIDEEVNEELINKINEKIISSIKDEKIFALSIILPKITTDQDLSKFVSIAKQLSIWNIRDDEEYDTNLTLIRISVDVDETTAIGDPINAWILGFGNFETFAKTRRSPYTELAMTVKSKQFFKHKYNKHSIYQYTPTSQHRDKNMESAHEAHLADIHLVDTTDNEKTDKKLWKATQGSKRRILGLPLDEKFDDPRTKAKVTLVIKDYSV
ncbi:hypothetical protein JYU16_02220 [bacterium AH-315-M05]|nr:hypothetical protein [bacterium AH-315-M05]